MGLRRCGDIWFLRKVIDGRRYERSTGFSDLKAARRRAAEIEVELRSGALGWTTACPTFGDWWKTYERTHAPSKRPRTQVRDRGTIAHALPHFGAKRLDAIRPVLSLRTSMVLERSVAGATVSEERYTPFTWHPPQPPTLTLIETCWEDKSTRRVLSCGIYQTEAGLEARAGYGEDLLRSQFARELGNARRVADDWKGLVVAKGFEEIS